MVKNGQNGQNRQRLEIKLTRMDKEGQKWTKMDQMDKEMDKKGQKRTKMCRTWTKTRIIVDKNRQKGQKNGQK